MLKVEIEKEKEKSKPMSLEYNSTQKD